MLQLAHTDEGNTIQSNEGFSFALSFSKLEGGSRLLPIKTSRAGIRNAQRQIELLKENTGNVEGKEGALKRPLGGCRSARSTI